MYGRAAPPASGLGRAATSHRKRSAARGFASRGRFRDSSVTMRRSANRGVEGCEAGMSPAAAFVA